MDYDTKSYVIWTMKTKMYIKPWGFNQKGEGCSIVF